MEEDSEYLKLSTEDQIVHKNWKARVRGYTDAKKLFQTIDDDKSPEWNKYAPLMKKIVADSNSNAQEKGLEAVLAFVEHAHVAAKTVSEVSSGIVNKCIGQPKARTKEISIQICLMYIEIEKQDIVLEELIKGTAHKNPKIAANCVNAITQSVREFGKSIVNFKVILKKFPALLEDRDKNVRDESKALLVEMYRWIGDPLKVQLNNLKPVQLQELETEFERIKKEKFVGPLRYVRSQQSKKDKLKAEMGPDGEEEESEEVVEREEPDAVDPYELLEPVDILSALPSDFYTKLESKKWQERKEPLDNLEQTLLKTPKLQNGDYADLVKALKKIVGKDSNVILVGVAAKCLALLVKALKKRFHPFALNVFPTLLEKFKEKKSNVVIPLREAVDAVFESTTLESLQEDILAAMDSKNPSVQAETIGFLARAFTKCTPVVLNKKLLKIFVVALLKTYKHPDPVVRDNSALALGTAMKVVGESCITPLLEGLETIKLTKIQEAAENAVITARMPKVVKKAPVARPATTPAVSQSQGNKTVTRGPATATSAAKSVKRAVKSATFIKKGGPTIGKAVKSTKPVQEMELSEEEVMEKGEEIFQASLIGNLSCANWKTRLSSLEQFKEVLRGMESGQIQSQVLIRLICIKPGLKDNNPQCMKLRLDCLNCIFEKFPLTNAGVLACLTDIISLLGDGKMNASANELLMLIAENTHLEYVSVEAMQYAFSAQKNPKVQQETLVWLSEAILQFGFASDKIIHPQVLSDNMKKAVSATNPNVRSAVITLLGSMYLYLGDQLTAFIGNEKLMNQVQGELDKNDTKKPPNPTRGKLVGRASPDEDVEVEEMVPKISPRSEETVIQRANISAFLTTAFIEELSHKDWKIRSTAVTKLQDFVIESKYITGQLGSAAPVIAQRLSDSNAKIATGTVALCESLAVAYDKPSCIPYVRTFFPGFLSGLGDTKHYLREAALKCINTWGDKCGYKEFFEGEMVASALKSGSPVLRNELWKWMGEKLNGVKPSPKDELLACLPYLYSNMEDRNADVRTAANEVVLPFMLHLGYKSMLQAADKLSKSSATSVKAALEKARAFVPEAPVKSVKSGMRVPSGGVVRTAAATSGIKSAGAIRARPSTVPTATSSNKAKKEEEDFSALLTENNLKNQRAFDENKLKVLKWNFTAPREEFVEQLKDQMATAGVNRGLINSMFHPDFKFHLKAIDTLSEDMHSNSDALACNFDLILKWMTLRFFDTNPSVLLRGLEYLQAAIRMLVDKKYTMPENEAASFLPYLVQKTGDPKDAVRALVKDIFDEIPHIYPVGKMVQHLMEGLKSKNARQRIGCLEELTRIIEDSFDWYQPSPWNAATIKEIAKQISDRDNGVRNAALNCVVAAYLKIGDKIRPMVSQLSEKEMSLLEERIKRVPKTRVVPKAPSASAMPVRKSAVPVAAETYSPYEEEEDEPEDMDSCEGSEASPCNSARDANLTITIDSPQIKKQGHFHRDEEFIAKLDAIKVEIPQPKLLPYDLAYFEEKITPRKFFPKQALNSTFVLNAHNRSTDNMEHWIEMIGNSNSIDDISKAIEEIERVLIVDEKRAEFSGMEDALMEQLTALLSKLHTSDDPEIAKCYKLAFDLLKRVFSNADNAKRISSPCIGELMAELLNLLIENRLEKLGQPMFVKSVNNLVFKVLEKSDHTTIFCTLLCKLYDTVANERESQQKYQDLIMKCIWNILRNIPAWDKELDYHRIFEEIHRFMIAFPSSWWKTEKKQDTPLRTYKTIIHHIVKTRERETISFASSIPGISEKSELMVYIKKNIDHLEKSKKNGEESGRVMRQNEGNEECGNNELTLILQKIGKKGETTAALYMLNEYRQKHPGVDLNHHFSTTSKFFKDYVMQRLEQIDNERQGFNNGMREDQSEELGDGSGEEHRDECKQSSGRISMQRVISDAQKYQERLKILRQKAGWDNAPDVAEKKVERSPVLEEPTTKVQKRLSGIVHQESSCDKQTLNDLTERLNAIKRRGKY